MWNENEVNRPLYNIYLNSLGDIPKWLKKYLTVPSIERLKYISYFCGMDYASKDIYNFKEPISRYDHSLTTALITWRFTNDKKSTLAALFHDVSTPCFSHAIDYMNHDYIVQESTEKYTSKIIEHDSLLLTYLKKDNIKVSDLDFKEYSIVDNSRPKLCADRFDGIILPGISWTKSVTENDIYLLTSNLTVYKNEDKELELGFKTESSARRAKELSDEISSYCSSLEDNYMMELLGTIARKAIEANVITEADLYLEEENNIYIRIKNSTVPELDYLIYKFENIKREEIKDIGLNVKTKILTPLAGGKRIK